MAERAWRYDPLRPGAWQRLWLRLVVDAATLPRLPEARARVLRHLDRWRPRPVAATVPRVTAIQDFDARLAALHARFCDLPGAVVAFSGGVDSAMLLHACQKALGQERVLAITARSPSLPAAELDAAVAVARELGARHLVVETHEMERSEYRRNAPDRCFFCKSELFEVIARELAPLPEARWPVVYGAIADDLHDHRPGHVAARQRGVLAPLADAGLTKDDVRRYSRAHGLSTAEKPSFACLSSRIPYGTPVEPETLRRLEAAEAVLRGLGFEQFRVRHHGTVARVELLPDALERAVLVHREAIVAGIRAAGYTYVALDLVGYRTGAMNEVLR